MENEIALMDPMKRIAMDIRIITETRVVGLTNGDAQTAFAFIKIGNAMAILIVQTVRTKNTARTERARLINSNAIRIRQSNAYQEGYVATARRIVIMARMKRIVQWYRRERRATQSKNLTAETTPLASA